MPPPAQAPAAHMLYEAAKRGDKARVQELIQKGVDVDKWKNVSAHRLARRWWELGRGARMCV